MIPQPLSCASLRLLKVTVLSCSLSFQLDSHFRDREPLRSWDGKEEEVDFFWFFKFTVIEGRFQENGLNIPLMHLIKV